MLDLEEMLDDLATLVNVESPSRDLEALAASAHAIAAMMEERTGTAPELVDTPAGPIVHWRGGGEPKVLVLGHHDTVHPLGSLADRPFTIADGMATGPGVFDMKAGIVQAIHAVADAEHAGSVEMLFTPDEEVGSLASKALLEARARACGAVLVLEPSADGGVLKIARKGLGTFEVFVHGRAAHAGLEPEKGVNALIEAAHQVLEIATYGRPEIGTTVTPTVAHVGTAENVVPALAHVYVDVRVEADGEKERIEAAMAALTARDPQTRIEVTGAITRPPMPETASATLFPLAVQVAAERSLPAVTGIRVGGGSDGNFTAAVGVPTLDGLGAVGGGAHADHEWVDVTAMPARAALLAGLIDAISSR